MEPPATMEPPRATEPPAKKKLCRPRRRRGASPKDHPGRVRRLRRHLREAPRRRSHRWNPNRVGRAAPPGMRRRDHPHDLRRRRSSHVRGSAPAHRHSSPKDRPISGEIGAAPVAVCGPTPATPTTLSPGSKAAVPTSTTSCCCAPNATTESTSAGALSIRVPGAASSNEIDTPLGGVPRELRELSSERRQLHTRLGSRQLVLGTQTSRRKGQYIQVDAALQPVDRSRLESVAVLCVAAQQST